MENQLQSITYQDKEIYLLGTAHVSQKSVEDVQKWYDAISPDAICIELCPSRLESMKNSDTWKNTNIFNIIKEKKAPLLFAQLILSSFYRKLGKELEVTPGAEMIEGYRLSQKHNTELILGDRNIEITLRRVWGQLPFWEKLRLLSTLLPSLIFSSKEKIDAQTIEELKNKDHLEHAMEEFTAEFPRIKKTLIHERDIHLAEMIKLARGKKILAVVGAGHVSGIKKCLFEDHDLDEISQIPPPSFIPKLFAWGLPILILGLITHGFLSGGAQRGREMIVLWVLLNGALSALGALIAMAHPVTIVAAFIAAPITSLNPTIGAGYVTGIVQTFFKKPTVADMENVPTATESIHGFWKNPLTRILLVFILSSLGSTIASLSYPFILTFRTG
ncbi:MAG: TraB/GumN family protein [Fibrobacterota bacterium]